MLARLFVVLILLATPLAAAAAPASPGALPPGTTRSVHADLAIEQPDLTRLSLTGDAYVFRYVVGGDLYDADDIGAAYHGANKHGKKVGAAFLEEVQLEMRNALGRTLRASFPDDQVGAVQATVDIATLAERGGDPFDPAVRVQVSASILRTRESVGLGELSDAAVEAAFDAGARLQSDLALTAEPGYRISYRILPPPGLRWEGGDEVAADGSALVVLVDNSASSMPSRAASARLRDLDASPPQAEDIRSAIDVAMGELAPGGIPLSFTISSDIRALDVEKRFPGALPASVQLSFVNADGLRALRAADAISAADIARADATLREQLRSDIERAIGADASVAGGLVADELARATAKPFTSERPLPFRATATTTFAAPVADPEDVELAFRVGATKEVAVRLFAANGRETSFSFQPPPGAEFARVSGGSVQVNGMQANVVVPAGAEAFEAALTLRGRGVPTYEAADARISVVVDITDIDASVGKALSGDLGAMLVDVRVLGEMKVIELPESARAALPSGVELRYVSSDGVRLLIESGHIGADDVARLEQELAKQVREKLGAALGGDVAIESSLRQATLSADLVSTPASADEPIVFTASARISKPLAGGPVQPQGAIALYTQQLPLRLPRIQGLDTVYTVIAPRGLAITDVSGEGVERGTSEDGRDQFTARPGESGSELTVSMAVTPTFVLAKFWPLVLLAVLLLVLIVGTPVALVVMKRRKGSAGKK